MTRSVTVAALVLPSRRGFALVARYLMAVGHPAGEPV